MKYGRNKMDKEKKIVKIHPSELGSWFYCHKKWLFKMMEGKKKISFPARKDKEPPK